MVEQQETDPLLSHNPVIPAAQGRAALFRRPGDGTRRKRKIAFFIFRL
jgi:hypothetical protein